MTCSCVQTGDGATSQNRQNTPDPSAITANMVPVNAPDSTFWIDRYENADLNRFTVTAPNLIPLTGLNIEEAKQRCRDQKKKLCTERQWLQACLGQRRDRFGYGQTSKEDQCNVNTSGVVPTGSKRRCRSDGQIYDMIGNVREWVDNDTTTLQAVSAGGSFRSGPSTNCFNRSITTTQARSQEVGFRCCLN